MLKKIEKYVELLTQKIETEGVSDPVDSMILKYSAICAVTAMLPGYLIPGSDFVVLTTIQAIMALSIAKHYGKSPSMDEIVHIIKSLGLTFALGFTAQQVILSLYRTVVPYFGGITTFGMVFSATYVIGKIMDKYYQYELNGKTFSMDEFNSIIGDIKKEGKKLSKKFNIGKLKKMAQDTWDEVFKTDNKDDKDDKKAS